MIPYSRQYVPKKDFKLVRKVLNSNFLTQGPVVKKFEKKISNFTNSNMLWRLIVLQAHYMYLV